MIACTEQYSKDGLSRFAYSAGLICSFMAFSPSAALAQIPTLIPFPETHLSVQERAVLESVRDVIDEINRLTLLSPGDAGYVSPRWVTLYQSRFDSPAGNPNRTRQASETRDATVSLILWRNGTNLTYLEGFNSSLRHQAQCVIRFTPDFWSLGPGPDRDSRIAHETYHCFQMRHKGIWIPAIDDWFFEGAAQVVGDYFGVRRGGVSNVGRRNINQYMSEKMSLFEREHDATGFFKHVADRVSMGDLLVRLQTLYAHKVSNPNDAGSERLLRILIHADEKESVEETWATRLWQAREPYPGFGDDWDYDYFELKPTAEYESEKVDFTLEAIAEREVELFPAQPGVIEVTVQPGLYYRVTVENAAARSIGFLRGGSHSLTHRYAEEETFTFCVGEDCDCPLGGRAYEFEILDDPEEEHPHLIIAATATTGAGAGQIIFGTVTIERLEQPPCCTGGLQPQQSFPDVTGTWRFRDGRLEAWAQRLRDARVEVYEDKRDARCTEARVRNDATVNISSRGAFVVDYGLTEVEFTCNYVADSGTNEVERTWKYEWWGQYGACITLQEPSDFRLGYPKRSNPVIKPLVENWFNKIGTFNVYNKTLDEDERPVTGGLYQPAATADAFWYDADSTLRYRQTRVINDNDGENTEIVDECTFDLTSPGCQKGGPRIVGEYHFFTQSDHSSWFDVFGSEDSATGLYVPLPFYFQEFSGDEVEYPNLVR